MRYSLLISFLILSLATHAQENISLQELKLKGPVKLFIERQNDTTVNEDGQTEYTQYHSVRLFSEDGRCTSFRDSTVTCTFDDGRQVKLREVNTSSATFEYDGNALLQRSVTKEYSANLRINKRESAHYATQYFYDDRARDIFSFRVSVKGDTMRFSRKIYNPQGHLGEYQMFSAADTGVSYKERYTYDEHARLIEEEVYNDLLESFQPQSKYTYNELGQVVSEQTYDSYGEPGDRSEYQYDNYGRVVTKSRYEGDMLLFEMSVQYLDIDEHGNYLKSITSFPGEKSKEVITRYIEYYP